MLLAHFDFAANQPGFEAQHHHVDGGHLEMGYAGNSLDLHFQGGFLPHLAMQGRGEILALVHFAAGPFPAADEVAIDRGATQQQTAMLIVENDGLDGQAEGLG